RNLIGKILVFGDQKAVITETEAYFGDDPASHGACGKTKRNFPMFGLAGHTYVYLIYGMYHCLNITTEKKGYPAAVLIRGLKITDSGKHFDGPGKLSRALGITREHKDIDVCTSKTFYLADDGIKLPIKKTPRIGIKKNAQKTWRFVVSDKALKSV
ncbi:3-methyladenine DNA glycosylase, partial [Candidatus Peregrinibacteria bacterium]|nr:3-methyladenine DNA glycosylase [Candidatus Peregrinibacteria bacterium]